MNKSIIETDRIILRKFVASDAEAVYEFGSNREVNRYTGETPLSAISEAHNIIINTFHQDYEKYGYGRWAVVYRPENRVIGFAGLKYLPEFDETDIGYRILPEYWGKGLATEMCIPILEYGFKTIGLNRIVGITLPENIASFRVLEKIGMHFYKVDSYSEEIQKVKWYRLNRSDYLKK